MGKRFLSKKWIRRFHTVSTYCAIARSHGLSFACTLLPCLAGLAWPLSHSLLHPFLVNSRGHFVFRSSVNLPWLPCCIFLHSCSTAWFYGYRLLFKLPSIDWPMKWRAVLFPEKKEVRSSRTRVHEVFAIRSPTRCLYSSFYLQLVRRKKNHEDSWQKVFHIHMILKNWATSRVTRETNKHVEYNIPFREKNNKTMDLP